MAALCQVHVKFEQKSVNDWWIAISFCYHFLFSKTLPGYAECHNNDLLVIITGQDFVMLDAVTSVSKGQDRAVVID